MTGFEPRSMRVVREGRIRAPIDRVFPLCCPVEEYRWIDGWKCRMVHCPNDRVEEGCIFREILSAPFLQGSIRGETTWTAVLHDPAGHRLHFELINEISTSLYRIEMEGAGHGVTSARLDFTYTSRNEKGDRIIANDGEAKLRTMLDLLLEMLRHYSETGQRLRMSGLVKLILRAADGLTFADGLRIAANRLAMALKSDPDRQRLLAKLGVDVR